MGAPSAAQRKSTFRSCVGEGARRSPKGFSIPALPNCRNSVTPPPQDTDTVSIASIPGEPDSLQAPVPVSSAPYPIPGSPARKVAASTTTRPHPTATKALSLASEVFTADTASKQSSPPRSTPGPPPAPATTPPPTLIPVPVVAERSLSVPLSRYTHRPGVSPLPASVSPSTVVTPAVLARNTTSYFSDIPRSMTPVGLDSDPEADVWAGHRARSVGSGSGSEASRGRGLMSDTSKPSLHLRGPSVAFPNTAPALQNGDGGCFYPEEIRPLIPQSSTPSTITAYPPRTTSSQIALPYHSSNPPVPQISRWAQPAGFDVNEPTRRYTYGTITLPHVDRGWIDYPLPNGNRYYVNKNSRAVTDLDLLNLARLGEISAVMNMLVGVPDGYEMWIRTGSGTAKGWGGYKARSELFLLWVDHLHRRVLDELSSDDNYVLSSEDDKLDDEYRYWAFIETHPAHIPREIVEAARENAITALHWSYTDRLLTHPHPQPSTPPFSQDECIELFKLLNDLNQQLTPAYTRTVARVFLRAAYWHQVNSRPHKPLPRDVPYQQTARSNSILRLTFELVLGSLCLGIPFLFADRTRHHGYFDTGSPPESTAPVSAIIVTASLVLMSYYDSDNIARASFLAAIVCSLLSVVSSLVSISHHKAKMARRGAPLAEEFTILSRRSIVLSLPVVFLAYSFLGFIAGIAIHFIGPWAG